MTALLTATGLSLPNRLEDTSLTLRKGELVCLVGPNGSGKTSLLHALAGIGSPAGEVLIDGTDPRHLGPEQRQFLLSYLPAGRDIKWPLMASDLIRLGLPKAADIDTVVEDLGLSEFMGRRIDRLSTGERSRVLIGRSLAARPKLLLLDEPVANLDPRWQLELMYYLRQLTAQGQTALVAVHDLEIARRYANRLIMMNHGRIEAEGDPAALLAGPLLREIFEIERSEDGWRPIRPPADPRSSP